MAQNRGNGKKNKPEPKPKVNRITLHDTDVVISREKLQTLEKELQVKEEKEKEYLEKIHDLEKKLGLNPCCRQSPNEAEQAILGILGPQNFPTQNLIITRVVGIMKFERMSIVDSKQAQVKDARHHLAQTEYGLANAKAVSDGLAEGVTSAVKDVA